MLKKGDKGNAVGRIQTALKAWNAKALPKWGVDKDYGAETTAWVRNYQTVANLDATGNTDGLTGAFLLEYLADHAAGSGGDYALEGHGHSATTTIT
jgi:peptidoglycan hydrolase-like protein with peptidoglycan-binding domain